MNEIALTGDVFAIVQVAWYLLYCFSFYNISTNWNGPALMHDDISLSFG